MAIDQVEALAAGDLKALKPLVDLLDATQPNFVLTDQAVRYRGGADARAACAKHLANFGWAEAIQLHEQEFRTLFPDDVHFEETMRGALATVDWASAYLRAFRKGGAVAVGAAQQLLEEMDAVAEEAAEFARTFQRMCPLISDNLHILQVLTLFRLQDAKGELAGKRILEVGPQDGGLFKYLKGLGAKVTGIDLAPKFQDPDLMQGDLMTADLGTFDAVVATAVFEFGSGWEHTPVGDARQDEALLDRLYALLNPGGVAIIENLAFPITFSADFARERGFEVLDVRLPHNNVVAAGRGCALMKWEGQGPRPPLPAPRPELDLDLFRRLGEEVIGTQPRPKTAAAKKGKKKAPVAKKEAPVAKKGKKKAPAAKKGKKKAPVAKKGKKKAPVAKKGKKKAPVARKGKKKAPVAKKGKKNAPAARKGKKKAPVAKKGKKKAARRR